ncbi:MAG TPA: MFS transporter [Acidimicrobiia bacterium]|nr:MFS transporter [Acidimicrobiia bacterium]
MSAEHAPFIPPAHGEQALPSSTWRVFGSRAYFKLWLAQVGSSLGDWIGLIAILAIAARVSNNSGTAVGLVMVARMVPGFFLATVGGVLVDRWDRRKVMVWCDVGRAALLAVLPFVDTLLGLILVSLLMEILTLLWGPAKDASVPHLVEGRQLSSANSLSLAAAYGTFPVGSLIFSLLAVLAKWLGHFGPFSALKVDREVLALWVDGLTFLISAYIVFRLPIPHIDRHKGQRIDWSQSVRDIVEGMRFIASHPIVRGVLIGLGAGLIGGGAMIPLGPVFAKVVLGGSSATFGFLMTALGMGAAAGVFTLLAVQRRLPRESLFAYAVMGVGAALIAAVSSSTLWLAAPLIALVGAFSGAAYVSGFTVLQENVADELRGRTFATLYTVIRLCLLLSLTVSPLFSDLFDWLSKLVFGHRSVSVAGASYGLQGVRIALWLGGAICIVAGWLSRREVRRARERGATA